MFCIARPVNSCGLNGREYLLDAFEYLIAEEEFPGADIFNLVLER